jgi:hypothetical protein
MHTPRTNTHTHAHVHTDRNTYEYRLPTNTHTQTRTTIANMHTRSPCVSRLTLSEEQDCMSLVLSCWAPCQPKVNRESMRVDSQWRVDSEWRESVESQSRVNGVNRESMRVNTWRESRVNREPIGSLLISSTGALMVVSIDSPLTPQRLSIDSRLTLC